MIWLKVPKLNIIFSDQLYPTIFSFVWNSWIKTSHALSTSLVFALLRVDRFRLSYEQLAATNASSPKYTYTYRLTWSLGNKQLLGTFHLVDRNSLKSKGLKTIQKQWQRIRWHICRLCLFPSGVYILQPWSRDGYWDQTWRQLPARRVIFVVALARPNVLLVHGINGGEVFLEQPRRLESSDDVRRYDV